MHRALLLAAVLVGTGGVAALPAPAVAAPSFALRLVVGGLQRPVHATVPRGDDRLFIAERAGRILVVVDGRKRVFLDLRPRVRSDVEEQGLLGLAFHPGFRSNGRLFVHYTDRAGDARVAEYRARGNRALPGSARTVWRLDDPYPNHNGGHLAFGPDGYLYLGMGDGGGVADPENRAQDPYSPFGKLLRFDVDRGRPYRIPPGNPFADGQGGAPLVWAVGLRNPWRFSFDRATGDLWIGDVGEDAWEEIDHLPRGFRGVANFGWDAFEGRHGYEPKPTPGRLVRPVVEVGHAEGACAITGGVVYRGRAVPALRGRYLYADLCRSWIRTVRVRGGRVVERGGRRGFPGIVGFGEDGAGEVYVTSFLGGVFRVVPAR